MLDHPVYCDYTKQFTTALSDEHCYANAHYLMSQRPTSQITINRQHIYSAKAFRSRCVDNFEW